VLRNPQASIYKDALMSAGQTLILCIDNEASRLAIRKLVLEQAGYKVVTSSDATTGWGLFCRLPIHLVVLDYLMPGLNGMQLARAMRLRKPHVPIVILSGCIDPPTEIRKVADTYIVKGEKVGVLLDGIRYLLDVYAT
jgi:DNA-binding response OmpR family regulator